MKNLLFSCCLVAFSTFFTACQKDSLLGVSESEISAKSGGTTSSSSEQRGGRHKPTPIDISALPTTVTDYITATYAGATIEKAGTLPDGQYVVLISVDGQTTGLLFDASGNFVKVLPPPPPGGPGSCTPTTAIEVSALPATVTDYIAATYAGATIENAGTLPNGNYVVKILVDGVPTRLVFDANGNFVEELSGPPAGGGGQHPHPTPIEVSALPTTVTDYITATYAGATIEKAGTLDNGQYIVLILVDGQPTGLVFNADGSFVEELPAPPAGGGHGGGHGGRGGRGGHGG